MALASLGRPTAEAAVDMAVPALAIVVRMAVERIAAVGMAARTSAVAAAGRMAGAERTVVGRIAADTVVVEQAAARRQWLFHRGDGRDASPRGGVSYGCVLRCQ